MDYLIIIPATSDTLLQAVNSWIKTTDTNFRIPCGASSTLWCLVALCLNAGIDEGQNNWILGEKSLENMQRHTVVLENCAVK